MTVKQKIEQMKTITNRIKESSPNGVEFLIKTFCERYLYPFLADVYCSGDEDPEDTAGKFLTGLSEFTSDRYAVCIADPDLETWIKIPDTAYEYCVIYPNLMRSELDEGEYYYLTLQDVEVYDIAKKSFCYNDVVWEFSHLICQELFPIKFPYMPKRIILFVVGYELNGDLYLRLDSTCPANKGPIVSRNKISRNFVVHKKGAIDEISDAEFFGSIPKQTLSSLYGEPEISEK